MDVTRCDLPINTAIDIELIRHAFFTDSYRVPLRRADASVVDIFFAVFGHHPVWLKSVLLIRHRVGALIGLRAARTSQIWGPAKAENYRVGQDIGRWPIHFLGDSELVAGTNDKHLDFRVSVLRHGSSEAAFATISTVCRTHNGFGDGYLRLIAPCHSWGVQYLLSRASQAGRL
jgi:Protein of unknown function (DUF2867)